MVLDTSAAFAILANEPDADLYIHAIVKAAGNLRISTVSLLELRIGIARRFGSSDLARIETFLRLTKTSIVSFDTEHAQAASDAYLQYGKGFHAAQLNFGDCAAYATAHLANIPLLFKGTDFSKTDVISALS